MVELIAIVVIATSVWVYFDAKAVGIRGHRKGVFDMGPLGWMFSCLLLWIVAFPVYLAKRSRYQLRGTAISDSLERIERLAALRDSGALTEEEYQREKRKLL